MTVDLDDADITRAVADVWTRLEPAASSYLMTDRVVARRARRRRRTAGIAVALVVVGVGGTAAARAVLGGSAPHAVQTSIAAVDEGLPADLQLHPDATHARSVAASGSSVLYVADLPDGGHCTEVAIGGRPKGAVCRTAAQLASDPVELTIPGTPEDSAAAPITVAGRITDPIDTIELTISSGARVPVALGADGYFIVQLDASQSAAARNGLRIEARAGATSVVSRDLTTAFASETDTLEPIAVEMVSGPNGLAEVSSFYGTVHVVGATSIRLVAPDGTTQDAPIAADGQYDLTVPAEQRAAYADRPGRLVVLDAGGSELASRTVAAVTYWVRSEQGG